MVRPIAKFGTTIDSDPSNSRAGAFAPVGLYAGLCRAFSVVV